MGVACAPSDDPHEDSEGNEMFSRSESRFHFPSDGGGGGGREERATNEGHPKKSELM